MGRRLARLIGTDLRTRAATGMLALAAVLLVAGLTLPTDPPPAPESTATAAPPAPSAPPAPITDSRPDKVKDQSKNQKPAGPPDGLSVPVLGLQVPVVPIEMDPQGVLTPPADVNTVGWWQRSAQPGAGRGQTLVTGHSVRLGDGAMDRIGELAPGASVRLRSGKKTTTYRATKVFVYSRAEVAANAQRLFGQDRNDGRLVLVTCTDWNGEVYESNIIVLAQPVAT